MSSVPPYRQDASMFIPKYDYCFCTKCHKARGDVYVYQRGEPPKDYVLPLGWRRYGIKLNVIPEDFTLDEIFTKWHMAFHGTRAKALLSIWKKGLDIPGQNTAEGVVIKPRRGHFDDKKGPPNFDWKQIFVSPSPIYAGKAAYAQKCEFYDPETKNKYQCQVALQVRIRPGSYKIGRETIGESNIDPHVSDEEMEWSTKDRNAVITTGILIRMD